MSVQKKPSKTILYEIERYCNNYFNPKNDPDSTIRNYPAAFLELANKIQDFNKVITDNKNIVSESLDDYSVTYSNSNNSWQKAFSSELSIYKRIKSL